uniref:Methyl-CpG binding domain protein 1 n=1 Tax=Nothobranchius rachovii TaxID=451742 RepID=A0A1A8RDY8_9TELE
MSVEGLERPQLLGSEPVGGDVGQSNTEENPEKEPAPSEGLKEIPSSTPVLLEDTPEDDKDGVKAAAGEPPVDWFEPLEEDDDAVSADLQDPDEESLAGEAESVAGSERVASKIRIIQGYRRKRAHRDEGWMDCPSLGEGWKRKEVVRRSGSSVGQKDVYYMSPQGHRVRSRVELATVVQGTLDLSHFDFKTGMFQEGNATPFRIRQRVKKKVRERSSSESSWMERGEGADTPDSYHRLTPNIKQQQIQTSVSCNSSSATYKPSHEYQPVVEKIKLPPPSSSRLLPLPSVKGEFGTEDSILVCAKCGISFTGTWYDKQRKRPCCPSCWESAKSKVHPLIRFRKWIPCGQCVGCHNSVNCGQCANCKHGLQSPEAKKRVCRKRRCICPIRKNPASSSLSAGMIFADGSEMFDDEDLNFQNEVTDSQHQSFRSSDTENFAASMDLDEEEMSTDDDDDWHKKRKRRSCGECQACLCRRDCGTCDFCVDKPKFGGSNKKRQKCRLRQCQRQAMRHLLPFQMGMSEHVPDGQQPPGRPRPHYTYSRKDGSKRSRGLPSALDFSDNEDEDSRSQQMCWSSDPGRGTRLSSDGNAKNYQSPMQLNHSEFGVGNGLPDRHPHISNHNYSQPLRWDTSRDAPNQVEEEEEELPMITQIYSLADNPAEAGVDQENQLTQLLHSLRSSVLPILWYAIMVEGPQLQLTQCSKQSNMADTVVLIDPSFCYYITVQKQPLLPTHSIYNSFPGRLSTANEVVSLLLTLERYMVCHGLPLKELMFPNTPVVLERAATCEFLVKKNEPVCVNCRALRRL